MLDNIPFASTIAILGGVIVLVAAIVAKVDLELAMGAYGLLLIGAGQLGRARNEAGRGIRQ